MSKIKFNLDNIMKDLERDETDKKIKTYNENSIDKNINNNYKEKKIIGKVEQFFEKISVAAIKLDDSLDVGDIIEIGNNVESIKQRVESIEINKKSIEHAEKGENIGIKLKWKVNKNDTVFKILNNL